MNGTCLREALLDTYSVGCLRWLSVLYAAPLGWKPTPSGGIKLPRVATSEGMGIEELCGIAIEYRSAQPALGVKLHEGVELQPNEALPPKAGGGQLPEPIALSKCHLGQVSPHPRNS